MMRLIVCAGARGDLTSPFIHRRRLADVTSPFVHFRRNMTSRSVGKPTAAAATRITHHSRIPWAAPESRSRYRGRAASAGATLRVRQGHEHEPHVL